jgi:endonuclease YncB( thermonuclease family)
MREPKVEFSPYGDVLQHSLVTPPAHATAQDHRLMFRRAAIAAFLLAVLASVTSFADVVGEATVVSDGDTIVVAGERVRLQGIDAPSCTRPAPPTAKSGRMGGPRRSG